MNNLELIDNVIKALEKANMQLTSLGANRTVFCRDAISDLNALREELSGKVTIDKNTLWNAWNELNTIRARDGVPYQFNGYKSNICEEYFSLLVDNLGSALGDYEKPWPPKQED